MKESSEDIMDTALGTAIGEVDELIDDSRPPRLYVFGRSGAGKSSLINALANKEATDVGAVEPTTVESNMYRITFPDHYASWDVVDSRGLFESVTPDGGLPADTVEKMRDDLQEYRPDILVHVMTPDHIRAGEQDFDTVSNLREELGDLFPPIVHCLNKIDHHMSPGDAWPPEDNPDLAESIVKNIDFVTRAIEENDEEITSLKKSPFHKRTDLQGYEFDSDRYIGVIPVFLREEPYWNVETLSWLIGDFLPESARLQFMQAQQRDELMRRMSRDITNRFAALGGGVGGATLPISDIFIFSGLQLFLVGLVGSFSCRELKWKTVNDYLTAMGGTVIAGLAARSTVRSVVQIVPGIGTAFSATVGYGGTWAIGRSAEEYFFNDKVMKPSEFIDKGKQLFKNKFK